MLGWECGKKNNLKKQELSGDTKRGVAGMAKQDNRQCQDHGNLNTVN